jgi:hypothetical protein
MDAERWDRVKAIFQDVIERDSGRNATRSW